MLKLAKTYAKCHKCGFNVTKQDKICPNCGIEHPRIILNPGLLFSANFGHLYMTWIVSLSLSALMIIALYAYSIGGGAYIIFIFLYFILLIAFSGLVRYDW